MAATMTKQMDIRIIGIGSRTNTRPNQSVVDFEMDPDRHRLLIIVSDTIAPDPSGHLEMHDEGEVRFVLGDSADSELLRSLRLRQRQRLNYRRLLGTGETSFWPASKALRGFEPGRKKVNNQEP